MRYVVVDDVAYYQGSAIVEADSPEEAREKYEEKWRTAQLGSEGKVIWVGELKIDDYDGGWDEDYIDCEPPSIPSPEQVQ